MNKAKRIYQHSLFPYFCMFLILFVYHYFIQITFGDEVDYFSKIVGQYSLGEFLSSQYYEWSSRLLIETVLIYVSYWNVWIWKTLNIAFYLLILYSFSYLFNFKNKRLKNWLIFVLVMLYPLLDMSTAGWIATTTNYLWPLVLGLYTFTAIKKYKDNIKIKWYEYILYFLAVLYAANSEQMNVVLLSILSFYIIFFLVNKKSAIFLWIMEALTVAELVFILTCPGNSVRAVAEIGRWMPDFHMLSFLDKVYLGFTDTINIFLSSSNYIFIIFCSILCFCVFIKTKNMWHHFISIIPLGIIFTHCFSEFTEKNNYLRQLSLSALPIDASNYFTHYLYVPLFIYVLLIGSILLSMLVIYDLTFDMLLNTFVLGVGLATRIIMGFSPTLYASNTRTLLFLYMAFIFCTIFMVYRFEEKFNNTNKNVFFIGTGIPLTISSINIIGIIINWKNV